MKYLVLSTLLVFSFVTPLSAESNAPWGHAKVDNSKYKPQKVVYDVASKNSHDFENVLDRASYLSKVYGANPFFSSIVLVMHGNEINYLAIKNYLKHKKIADRAQSLSVGGTIKFKMCKLAAQGYGYEPEDIHGFIELVPMADAEIVRLQSEEDHTYMR